MTTKRERLRRRPGAYGYGGGIYGMGWWGDRDDGREDLTMTNNLSEQFDGIGDGGGDSGGDGGGGGGE